MKMAAAAETVKARTGAPKLGAATRATATAELMGTRGAPVAVTTVVLVGAREASVAVSKAVLVARTAAVAAGQACGSLRRCSSARH